MSRRHSGQPKTRGYQPTATTRPGTPPAEPAGASSANPLPTGPALAYIAPSGTVTAIDETAVTDARDRALCRALLTRAGTVLTEAETATDKNPVGFTA